MTMRHKLLNKRLKEAEGKADHCKQPGLDKNNVNLSNIASCKVVSKEEY